MVQLPSMLQMPNPGVLFCCFKKNSFQSLVCIAAEMLYPALAPSDTPSTAPDIAAEPSSELASRKS